MVSARRTLRADLRLATDAAEPKPIPEPECEPVPELQGPASGQMVVLAIIEAERIQHRRRRLHVRQPASSDIVVTASGHGSHQKYRRVVVPAHQSGCGFERATSALFPVRKGRSSNPTGRSRPANRWRCTGGSDGKPRRPEPTDAGIVEALHHEAGILIG
jgi:hypothetical protein